MKTALMTEFSLAKPLLLQMAWMYPLIGLFIGYLCESLYAMVSCIAAMTPMMMLFTCSSYDAQNGWERFRACLPVSRTALVVSRYALVLATTIGLSALGCAAAFLVGTLAPSLPFPASTGEAFAVEAANSMFIVGSSVLGACVIMIIVSIMMPLVMRFGMSIAMRVAPLVMVLLIPAIGALVPQGPELPQYAAEALAWIGAHPELACACVVAVTLTIYAVSCAVATAMCRTKEL